MDSYRGTGEGDSERDIVPFVIHATRPVRNTLLKLFITTISRWKKKMNETIYCTGVSGGTLYSYRLVRVWFYGVPVSIELLKVQKWNIVRDMSRPSVNRSNTELNVYPRNMYT